MIVSEEIHTASNTCTMETARAALEESIFGQAGGNNEVAVTRFDTPAGWTGNSTAKVSRIGTNSGHNIGPNTLQKVMAGDVVNATVLYYHQGSAGGNSSNMVNTILGSLLQAITGGNAASNLIKGNASNITNQLSGVSGFINAVQPGGSNPPGNVPQAFLTAIFFDERFNFIPAAEGGVAQQQVAASVGSNGSSLTLASIKAPKNGYAFIYISNQSNNDVYFDDLLVGIVQGNIAEENHYYAYGLKIATLSSKKLGDSYEGSLKNNYLYQGAYSELDDDIGWNDFALRNYDPQIGRWAQMDPYNEFASSYVGMGDDPINLVDPSGGFVIAGLTKAGTTAILMIGGAIIGTAVGIISGDDDFTGTLIGAGIGLGAGLANLSLRIAVSMGIQMVSKAITYLDTPSETRSAGTSFNGPNAPTENDQPLSDDPPGIDPAERVRILAAIALGEGGNGYTFSISEIVQIAYVYVHREAKGKPLGDGSSFYANKSVAFRMYMYIFGSPKYASDNAAKNEVKKQGKEHLQKIKDVYQEIDCYLNPDTSKDFENIPAANNPNITVQGFHKDLNGEMGDPFFWNRVRWYVYLIYSGLIPKTTNLYVILGDDALHKNATFLVDEVKLNKFVNVNKGWIDKLQAPKYDPVIDKFIIK